ncbi:MAG: Uma2 family endonuclease [Epsilonproteobacteria bacterium]|nr:Uma2 family endonuclease [Campylobacterota bacterium]NPA64575.1 Uma2 family endonuclease [Campylobacterota bacterium]
MALAYKLPYTYKDYSQWEGDWELINGEAVAMAPSPFGPHQSLLIAISSDIRNALKKCPKRCFVYAELDYIIDEFNVFRPDIALVCQKVKDFIRIPPKLIVEILSPSTALKDRTIKFQTYQNEGVEYYMMVDYELRKVALYKRIDFEYKKIDEKEGGVMEMGIESCKVEFFIDEWWEVI